MKDLGSLDNFFYETSLSNILFNLSYFQLVQSKQGNHQKYRQIFAKFVFSLNPDPNKMELYCRPSRNIMKQIKKLYSLFGHSTIAKPLKDHSTDEKEKRYIGKHLGKGKNSKLLNASKE